MIWIRLVLTILAALLIIYYVMLVLHCLNVVSFTKRKITIARCLTPFYYWIKSEKEPQNKNQ